MESAKQSAGDRPRVEGDRDFRRGTDDIIDGVNEVVTATLDLVGHVARRTADLTAGDRFVERPSGQTSSLNVIVHYAKPVAAARWLCDAFGFETTTSLPDEDSEALTWIEVRVGNGAIMLYPTVGETAGVTHQPFVYVDDVEAHFDHASAAGATIVEPIKHHGFKAYVVEDLEGRRWTFAQARPTMT